MAVALGHVTCIREWRRGATRVRFVLGEDDYSRTVVGLIKIERLRYDMQRLANHTFGRYELTIVEQDSSKA